MALAQASGKPTEGWGKRFRYVLPVLVIASGFACHGIFTTVNFLQGMSIGYNDWSHMVFGSLSLAVDVIGVGLCSAIAGRLRASNQKWKAKKVMMAVYVSAAYSLLMFYGYNASERIEPTKQAEAHFEAVKKAKVRSERAMAESRANYIAELMEQAKHAGTIALDRSKSRSARKAAKAQQELYLKQAGEASFKPIQVDADPVAASRDAMAVTLASHIGWRVVSVQEGLGLMGALILMMISITAIRYGFEILPKPELISRRRAVFIPPANDDRKLKKLYKKRSIEADDDLAKQIIQWMQAGTSRSAGAQVQATKAWEHFVKFQIALGAETSSLNAWGKAMAQLNKSGRISWPKHPKRAPRLYIGRVLRNDVDWASDYEHPYEAYVPRGMLALAQPASGAA